MIALTFDLSSYQINEHGLHILPTRPTRHELGILRSTDILDDAVKIIHFAVKVLYFKWATLLIIHFIHSKKNTIILKQCIYI